MADHRAVLTFIAKDAASGPIKGIQGALGGLKGAAGGVAGGIKSALGGIAGFATSTAGILAGGGIVAGLTAAANAAAEDAASVAKLDQIIKANARTQGDYTAALERTIAAGQRLAFSDDDTRASLGRLVTSTKDVEEAMKLNAIAMDLARLKGIPLADAANMVGKVHDGNVGILKRYGISVGEGATATEALAAIQAAAAGQAETYAGTQAGAMTRLQDAFGEAAEGIGALVLPAMQALVSFTTDNILPAIEAVIGAVGNWISDNQALIAQISGFIGGALTSLQTTIQGKVIPVVSGIAAKFGDLVKIVVTEVVPTLLDLARRVWEGGLNRVVEAGAKLIGSVLDVLRNLWDAISSNEAVMEALRTAADLIGQAFAFTGDALITTLDFLGDLGDWITGNKTIMAGLRTVAEAIGRGFGIAADAVGAFLGFLRDLVAFAARNLGLLGELLGFGGGGGNTAYPPPPGKAAGGPVTRGRAYVVGEAGPELFVPRSTGTIVPGVGGGGGLTLAAGAIVVNGVTDPDEVARTIMLALKRETSRQGVTF